MSFAFAEIKLTNLEKNVANIRKEIGNGVRILAVVKANAYGHGSVEISKKLTSLNVNDLAVATYEEAIEIQSAGIKANILILGLSDFFANLGGGGGYAWIIGASLGAVVHLAISKR